MHTLVYSEQCPNCIRFMDALRQTTASAEVSLVDVGTLSNEQLARVQAVPALVLSGGQTLYGTKAFEWLRQYEGDVELQGFSSHGTLAFSDVNSAHGYATYAESFSAFEPVAE